MAAAVASGSFAEAVDRCLADAGCPLVSPEAFTVSDPAVDLSRAYWHWFEDPLGPRVHLVESVYTPWTRAPNPALPFARERGWLGGDSAEHLADLYRTLGLAVPEEWAHAPDHLALELEFLALLIEHGTPAQEDQFLRQHLSWLPDLVGGAEAAGVDGFYGAALRFAAAVVDWDLRR
jgi:TorA maturation chaperone TorD